MDTLFYLKNELINNPENFNTFINEIVVNVSEFLEIQTSLNRY
jgi:chemotaxis protein methyltransferase CheR